MRTIQTTRRVEEWALRLTATLCVALCTACGEGGDDDGTSPQRLTCDQNPNQTRCPTAGNIQVIVNGVPNDVPAPRIELYLADGSELSGWGPQVVMDGSGTFADLEPGPYTVVALPTWKSPTILHSANSSQFNVRVTPGKTAQATFAFSTETFGAIEFTVQGLPNAGAGLLVQGPNGSRTQLVRQGVNIVAHLDAGEWMLTLPNVMGFVPQSRTIQATVTAGSITPAPSVTYVPTGILALEVAGLPAGVMAEGTITGPNGFSTPLKSFVWDRVVVGTYTATPTSVSSAGVTYTASAQTAVVTRAAATRLTVTYAAATTGNIQVIVNGVPSDVPAPQIELYPAASNGFDQVVIDGSGTFANLAPGPYDVVAQPTSNSPTVRHSASPDQFNVTVVPGHTAQLIFSFSPQTLGAIEFTVQGLPSANWGNLILQGPNGGGTWPVRDGVNTVPHLDAGAWMITLPNVNVFMPQSRTIQAVATTGSITPAPSVTYTASGILALAVAGLPSGVMAEGTITGPNGFSTRLSTFVWDRVVVGTYTATPTSVSSGGVTYTASAQTAVVTRAAAARLTLTYGVANPD